MQNVPTRSAVKPVGGIERATATAAPSLLTMPGVGPLTTAKIVGETAGIARFSSEAAFARYTGIAPIRSGRATPPAGSDSPGGQPPANAAVHRIAITQIRLDGLGQAYYRKKRAEGMTKPEALRCLKRRLVRIVFGHLHTDQQPATKAITTSIADAA